MRRYNICIDGWRWEILFTTKFYPPLCGCGKIFISTKVFLPPFLIWAICAPFLMSCLITDYLIFILIIKKIVYPSPFFGLPLLSLSTSTAASALYQPPVAFSLPSPALALPPPSLPFFMPCPCPAPPPSFPFSMPYPCPASSMQGG